MTTNPTNTELRAARKRWIGLNREPATEQARRLVAVVAGMIEAHTAPKRTRPGTVARPIGPGKLRQVELDVGTILAGLLSGPPIVAAQLGKAGGMWEHAPIKWDRFWSRVGALDDAGLVGVAKGGKGKPGANEGHATKLWATDRMWKLADEHGLVLPDDDKHWHISKAAQRAPRSIKDAALVRITDKEGRASALSRKPDAAVLGAMREQVGRLNAYVAQATVSGCVFPVFERVFGGDIRLGGRLYAVGGGDTCQNIKKRLRPSLRINGEPLAEVDVRASQLSIFLKLVGQIASGDPYILPGALSRDVVKTYCVQSFGNGELMAGWGEQTDEQVRAVPVKTVRKAVLARYPAMADMSAILPADLRASPPPGGIAWAAGQHLAYLESTAIVAALDYVMARGVVGLPLHDALLVPESGIDAAIAGLRGAFLVHLGFEPEIKVKRFNAGS